MMTQLNLRQRLLLLTLLPSALIAVVTIAFFTYGGIRALEAELRDRALSTVRFLAPVSEYSVLIGQTENLQTLVQTTVQEHGIKSAMILGTKGRPLAVSGRVSLDSEFLKAPPAAPGLITETRDWVAYGAPIYRAIGQVDALFEGEDSLSEAAKEAIGFVVIEIDKGEVVRKQQALMQQALILVALGLLFIGGISVLVADRLGIPLLRLVSAVRAIGEGRLSTRIGPITQGEMGVLEQGFNDMATHIEQMRDTMQSRIEEATAQLAFQASRDPLTGLFNRREFAIRLDAALAEIRLGAEPASLLYIDLDRFKPVNDSCGHQAGDDLLCQISQLFQSRLRDVDVLARLGGDEFGILLRNCHGKAARQVADDLCAMTAAYRFIWQDKVFSISASIGITTLNADIRSGKDVIAAADAGCYQAKALGRNTVCEQLVTDTGDRRQSSEVADRIRSALDQNRLQAMAQPLLALQSGGNGIPVIELSGLIREPGQNNLALKTTLEDAEREGLALDVQKRLLDTAIRQLARAQATGRPFICLLPVSAAFVGNASSVDLLEKLLQRQAIDGSGLCLMLPEEAMQGNPAPLLPFVDRVRACGCALAISNFGGGLASFSQIRLLRPSFIKLNPSLTRNIGDERPAQALLRAVREVAQDLDIRTIASELSSNEDLQQVQTLQVDYIEGPLAGPIEPLDIWIEGALLR